MSSAEKIKRLFAKSDVTVNSKVDDRIINDALTVFDKSEKTKSVSAEPNIWRMIMKSRITKLAAAAVIIIVILIGISQFSDSIDGSSIVWADVVEQIRTFRPNIYKQTIQYETRPDKVKQVMHFSLSRRREIWADGSIRVFDMSKKPVRILTLYPDKKQAIEMTLTDMGPAKDPDLLRILAGRQDGTEEDLGITEIEGRKVKIFHSPDKINDFTVWADVETGLPVRIELLQEQLKRTIVMEEFEFDVDFDEALFSVTAPKGYSVKKVEKKGRTPKVTVKQVRERATFETYVFAKDPCWTGTVQIIEAEDPSNPDHLMYVFASIADDGRHLVLAQSQTYNMMLGPKIKQGRLVYTSPNGFKVWGGGPEKWYSEILLKSAREIILDPPSQERIGYALESPAGTFPILAINGPITDEELRSVVDNLVPAKEYKEE
ncbi:MAG: LolA family protein [Planctomycetota bacterium]|jgi:hypothetical protein